MFEAQFAVTPAGIVGMNALAVFLNAMKRHGAITDWSPDRAVSGSKGERYVVQFGDKRDAALATAQWAERDRI